MTNKKIKIKVLKNENIERFLSRIQTTMRSYHREIDQDYDDKKEFGKILNDIKDNAKSYLDVFEIIVKYVDITT